jgi:hypothetical protein
MKIFCYSALSVLFFILLFSAFERPAYAYVDPGSSLLVYQSLSAMAAATVFYLRRRIQSLFRGRNPQPVSAPVAPAKGKVV